MSGVDGVAHRCTRARRLRYVDCERRGVENEVSDARVREQLIAKLPELARELPKPDELRTISVGNDGPMSQLPGLIAGAADAIRPRA